MLGTCSTRGLILTPVLFLSKYRCRDGTEFLRGFPGCLWFPCFNLPRTLSSNLPRTQVIFSDLILNSICPSFQDLTVLQGQKPWSHIGWCPAVTQHKAVVSSPHSQHLPCSVFSNWEPSPAFCATSYPGMSITNSKIS